MSYYSNPLIKLSKLKKKSSTMDPDRNLDVCFETVMKLVDEAGEVGIFISLIVFVMKKKNLIKKNS